MADIETTLKTRTNQDNVFPNIRSGNIPSGAVTTQKIADGAVTAAKIADGAITNDKIAAGAIYNNNIVDGEIDSEKLAYASVGTNQLQDGSVTIDKLVDNSVGHDQLRDNSVGDSKIRKTGGVALTNYQVSFGSWEAFLADLMEKVRSPLTTFYYEYAVNSSTWYCIRPRSVWVCTSHSDPTEKGIEFVFDLPDGTTKTVTWTTSQGEPDEAEYIYINFVD